MKTLLVAIAIIGIAISCKKRNDNSATLALLQHKWMITSLNGEALRYIGTSADYFNFATDSKLYQYAGNIYDTAAYNLSSDGKTLSLYPVTNGVQSATPNNFTIRRLDDSQLIIFYSSGPISSIDSLKR